MGSGVSAITLIKLAIATLALALMALTCLLSALWFGRVLFRPPAG